MPPNKVPTPIPEALWQDARSFFSAPLWLILWRAFIIIGGAIFLAYLLVITSGWLISGLITALVGVIVVAAFSREVRKVLVDLFRAKFHWLRLR